MCVCLGISVPALALEIFRQSIFTTYHYHHGYAILLYLDHALVWLQQSLIFFLVLSAKNHDAAKNGSLPAVFYYMIPIMYMSVILPKYTFDYLIVSIVSIFLFIFCSRFFKILQLNFKKKKIRSCVRC